MSEHEMDQGSEQGQPAEQAPAKPETRAGFKDKQTAETTPLKDYLPPRSPIIRELTEEEKEQGFISIFLGNSKKDVMAAQAVIKEWLGYRAVVELFEADQMTDTAMAQAKDKWNEYVTTTFPGKTAEDVANYAKELYVFMSEVQDELRVRSKVMTEKGITNIHNRGGEFVTADIVAQTPSRKRSGFKTSEGMRRSSAKAAGKTLQFDLLLRNSFVQLNFTRPNRTLLGNLVNDIRRTVTGYVRSINNNNAVLARVAAMKVIWDFLVQYINSSSVSDIVDYNQLAEVITITDFDRICTALIEATSHRGTNMNLRCLNTQCDWDNFSLVDPTLLSQNRPGVTTDEELAILGNLQNKLIKLTLEETRALSLASKFNLEDDRVWNDEKNMYFEIAAPTLSQAFQCFDYFISQVNPRLGAIRSKVTSPDEYDTQISLAYADIGATEYIHWVSKFVDLAPPNTDEEDIVYVREEEEDLADYYKGIYDVVLDHDSMNANLTKFILNKTPYMSRTFTGVANYVCPKCGGNSADHQDPEQFLDRPLGYTPIDPIMSFFIHTQLMIVNLAVVSQKALQGALSD